MFPNASREEVDLLWVRRANTSIFISVVLENDEANTRPTIFPQRKDWETVFTGRSALTGSGIPRGGGASLFPSEP